MDTRLLTLVLTYQNLRRLTHHRKDEIGENSSSALTATPKTLIRFRSLLPGPPSYRSQTTITAPPYDLPYPMTFELLPRPLFDEIASYLPISSRLCLRYTCLTFFHSLSEQTSDILLGLQ